MISAKVFMKIENYFILLSFLCFSLYLLWIVVPIKNFSQCLMTLGISISFSLYLHHGPSRGLENWWSVSFKILFWVTLILYRDSAWKQVLRPAELSVHCPYIWRWHRDAASGAVASQRQGSTRTCQSLLGSILNAVCVEFPCSSCGCVDTSVVCWTVFVEFMCNLCFLCSSLWASDAA